MAGKQALRVGNRGLLESIIEMGVDLLNPVQTTAEGMDPRTLKQRYGGRLVLWGGSCDCQGTLTHGTPQQVRDEVRANLDVFDPLAGGYVFASVHNIQANVPPRNVVALFDAARAHGPGHGHGHGRPPPTRAGDAIFISANGPRQFVMLSRSGSRDGKVIRCDM